VLQRQLGFSTSIGIIHDAQGGVHPAEMRVAAIRIQKVASSAIGASATSS
jgi:hypothetical protein